MRSILRIALPVGFGVWFLLAMVLRSWLVYRRTGKNPIVLPWDDSAHGYIGNHTDLVERGLYRRSRNPIYVGMLGALVSLALLVPNALTMTCAGVGFVLIQIQTRLEEEHLLGLHGAAYEAYRRRVRRWI